YRYLRDGKLKADVTGSVLVSFIANHGHTFAEIKEPGELWELFGEITIRHCGKHNKKGWRRAQKHGPNVPLGGDAGGSSAQGFRPVDPSPSPDQKAMEREYRQILREIIEECERTLVERYPKIGQRLCGVLTMHLIGALQTDIAQTLGVSPPTIGRDLE